ncbi:MAG: hypothetical protein AB1515_09775 [Nitrospirota bacterium]
MPSTSRFFMLIAAVALRAALLGWGIWGWGGRTDAALASLAEEADLSRSIDGEMFEDDSHAAHDELGERDDRERFERDHEFDGEHEASEDEHDGGEHEGGPDDSGDSGGDD